MEFTRQQLKEFNRKGFLSVAARFAQDAERMLEIKGQLIEEMNKQLENGRNYLMSVKAKNITVSDALEAFGFGRNGLKL